jgi:hypothetical protein
VAPQHIQAKNYTNDNRGKGDITLIVIHDMEAPEKGGTAESCARYFAGDNAPRASAHDCIDVDSVVTCVRDEDVAWHAPGVNPISIGLEHAGYARQTAAEWRDPYSTAMLRLSAQRTAMRCITYGIPITYRPAAALAAGGAGLWGITKHDDVSKAFRRSDHWDPGPWFPMDWYLDSVRHAAGQATMPEPPMPTKTVWRLGDRGEDVKFLQGILNVFQWRAAAPGGPDPLGNRQGLAVTGVYDTGTAARVKEFERFHREAQERKGQTTGLIQVDGITTHATLKALAFWVEALK